MLFPTMRGRKVGIFTLCFTLLFVQLRSQDRPVVSKYKAGDLIDNKFYGLKGFPDTLLMGAFTLVVEEYDKGGEWHGLTKTFTKLNGIGRIKFRCSPGWFPWLVENNLADAVLKPVKVKIVDTVRDAEQELTPRDAVLLGLTTRSGTEVELLVPDYAGKAVNLSRYLNDLVNTRRLDGIRVRFKDVSAHAVTLKATKATVIAGIATYPSEQPFPAVPFQLNVASGFRLKVDSLTIFSNGNAKAHSDLVLPSSLTANADCRAATLHLGDIAISQRCEFYKNQQDSTFGIFGVGNTTLNIAGRGYVADFSSLVSYPPSGKPGSWKGVVLLQGGSKGSPADSTVSNIGYMQAGYKFTNGLVESTGLTATFTNTDPYRYGSSQPLGYLIAFQNAEINVRSSKVSSGFLQNGRVALPRTAIRYIDDADVILSQFNARIMPDMDVMGTALFTNDIGVYFGDFIKAGGGERKSFGVKGITRQAYIYFSAAPRKEFLPISADGKSFASPFISPSAALMDFFGIQGAVLHHFSMLGVNTRDIPGGGWKPNDPNPNFEQNRVWFRLSNSDSNWMNIVTEGVHFTIRGGIKESPGIELGDPNRPLYAGINSFKTKTFNGKQFSRISLQCIESAVINCDFQSFTDIPDPTGQVFSFTQMVFTSTSDNAGGKLQLPGNDSLKYWGLGMVQKPGFSSAGLVSVRTGQIIVNAAGLTEQRHFAQPFWLTWGEILASGAVGRLFFDYNAAGQQFDHFNFIHDAVSLSPYSTSSVDTPYLRVGGTTFLPFFGGDYMHVLDRYDTSAHDNPFNQRRVKLIDTAAAPGFLPTDHTIAGNWKDGLAKFDFNIDYAVASQDGFIGAGLSGIRYLTGGNIGSYITMNSRGSCIRIGSDLNDQRSIALGPVANVSNITRIWGCACIVNDDIENIVVGGEVTNAANVSIAARGGSFLSAILQLTPSMTRFTLDGEAYLSLVASFDALVSGHMQLTLNTAQGFAEGEVKGKFRVAGSNIIQSGSLEAEGQMNWHLGLDYEELQGLVSLKLLGLDVTSTGGGAGVGAGFYIGLNAPRDNAWVLRGQDPRFALNMEALPDRLTGVYGSLHIQKGISFSVLGGGGIDIYAGLGAFVFTPLQAASVPGAIASSLAGPAIPYVIGNLGGRIYGDILGGVVSASAWMNLQLIGPIPFSFQGSVGLEACLLFACYSTDLTVGLNSSRGFYVE